MAPRQAELVRHAAQQAQVIASEAQTEQAQAALTVAQQQAARYRDLAWRLLFLLGAPSIGSNHRSR